MLNYGFNYIVINFISWFICLISAIFIFLKSPLKKYQKVLFLFSAPMIYLYPVISRCYCLIPLAISLIAYFYKDRKEKPIRYILSIVLLANTHIIMYGMVGVLLLAFLIECFKERKNNDNKQNKKYIISFILAIVLILISMYPIFSSLIVNKTTSIYATDNILETISVAIMILTLYVLALMPTFTKNMNNELQRISSTIIIMLFVYMLTSNIVITLITIPMIYLCLKLYPKYSLQFLLIIFWQLTIYIFIYDLSIQRLNTIILIIMFFKWINCYEKENIQDEKIILQNSFLEKIFIIFMIITLFFYGIIGICQEIMLDYSYGKEIAEYIDANIEEGSIFITAGAPECITSIIPYLSGNYSFYHLTTNTYISYATWDENIHSVINEDYGIDEIREIFGKQKIYYIACYGNFSIENDVYVIENLTEENCLEELYSTEINSIIGEDYCIYEIDLSK